MVSGSSAITCGSHGGQQNVKVWSQAYHGERRHPTDSKHTLSDGQVELLGNVQFHKSLWLRDSESTYILDFTKKTIPLGYLNNTTATEDKIISA